MSYRVFKFGGTSVQDAAAIARVAAIVGSDTKNLVVTLSAMGGVTDLLLGAADKAVKGQAYATEVETFERRHLACASDLLEKGSAERVALEALIKESAAELNEICRSLTTLKEATRRVLDTTAARGERLLARIFCALMKAKGIDAVFVDATKFIKVEKQFGALFPQLDRCEELVQAELVPLLKKGTLVVIPGYIGTGPDGELVTLGRGGSDLSATVVGHALAAKEVILYKEVDGLLTADPKYVPEARIVPELHYREAAELAYYGAKVLHSRTIIPLIKHQIPLRVKNTFQPQLPGTRIAGDVSPGDYPVKALTAILGQTLLSLEGSGMMGVPGIAARTFQALAQHGISVAMISQASSEASICLVVPDTEAKGAVLALREAFKYEIERGLVDDVQQLPSQAVLAVVGLGMAGTPGIASRTFVALARANANVEAIAQGSSELNISVVVDQASVAGALRSLHREFRLEKLRALPQVAEGSVDVALFGLGQIGRALARQLVAQQAYLKDKMKIDMRVVAAADSSGVAVAERGFSAQALTDMLAQKELGQRIEPDSKKDQARVQQSLRERLWQLPLARPIFVDMTAEDTYPILIEAIKAGWNVALANKKPLAVPQGQFDDLFALARDKGVEVRYEATVGAGLPILDTLAKLADAGDEVKGILGCFSGTLGFLMTELGDGVAFSEAVRKAHSLGYTEPDPREDLSGMDVARKALILARTLGLKINLGQMRVEALFPDALGDPDAARFIDKLKQVDALWADKVTAAKRGKKELRYVARIAGGEVSVGIEAVPADSPLGRLRGTDNQVSVTTKRYDKNALIVSGPGAGAAVTAAGVLNDLVAIAAKGAR